MELYDDDDDGIAPPRIEYPEPPPRRQRGGLEADICRVFDLWLEGKIDLDGKPLTPHRVGKELIKIDSLTHKPSTGGISLAMDRFVKAGFIKTRRRPFAFLDYTDRGRELGWEQLRVEAKIAA